jgi:hypothetical protein
MDGRHDILGGGSRRWLFWLSFVVVLLPSNPESGLARTEAAPKISTADATVGQLVIEGQAIEGLVLEKRVSVLRAGQENLVRLDRPGPSVLVPAGEYRVQEVRLRGLYRCSPPGRIGDPVTGQVREVGWFSIQPDKPYTIRVGAPLKPTLRVFRCDRTLRMGYQLSDVSGQEFWNYLPANFQGGKMADFAVYSGDELVGSGAICEYG